MRTKRKRKSTTIRKKNKEENRIGREVTIEIE